MGADWLWRLRILNEVSTTTEAFGEDSRRTDRRMALAREWDELVDQVRALDGFADFLRPPPLKTLLRAAAQGPVVVVNVSRWRCDALVVTAAGVVTVKLKQLSLEEVATRTSSYLQALRDVEIRPPAPEGGPRGSFADFKRQRGESLSSLRETLKDTMEWLWDVVAQPVLEHLHLTGTPNKDADWTRLWWCPTGLLTLLPLHAAGYHDAADGRTVLDRVISSYTPTLRALAEWSTPAKSPGPQCSDLLFVGVPDVDGRPALTDDVSRERALLEGLFHDGEGGGGGLTVIEGSVATVQTVRDQLAEHRWVHISCHGYQDLVDPSAAGFRLSDGLLTVAQISTMRYAGEFAFLGACKTATGGLNLPDEVITLAAALSYTGYRHVVATLWSVDTEVAALVTEKVYPDLVDSDGFHPECSAAALHHAVRSLRQDGHPLDDWLPFTHSGP